VQNYQTLPREAKTDDLIVKQAQNKGVQPAKVIDWTVLAAGTVLLFFLGGAFSQNGSRLYGQPS
jgi:hypothetical protein